MIDIPSLFTKQKISSGQILFFFKKVDTVFVFTFLKTLLFLTSCMVLYPPTPRHYPTLLHNMSFNVRFVPLFLFQSARKKQKNVSTKSKTWLFVTTCPSNPSNHPDISKFTSWGRSCFHSFLHRRGRGSGLPGAD